MSQTFEDYLRGHVEKGKVYYLVYASLTAENKITFFAQAYERGLADPSENFIVDGNQLSPTQIEVIASDAPSITLE